MDDQRPSLPPSGKSRYPSGGMPKVFFVQEHREVDVEPGRTLRDIALEIGIDPNRKYQRLFSCDGKGIFDGCKCWVREKAPGALNPRTFTERTLHSLRGWQRLACQVRVLGDVEVWTMPQGDERLRVPRPVAPPPPRPPKRERFLESIYFAPAPDEEEGEDAAAAAKAPVEKSEAKPVRPPRMDPPQPALPPEQPAKRNELASPAGDATESLEPPRAK